MRLKRIEEWITHAYIEETYESQLGTLELFLNSSARCVDADAKNGVFITDEHEIIVKQMIPRLNWLPVGMPVESAKGGFSISESQGRAANNCLFASNCKQQVQPCDVGQ